MLLAGPLRDLLQSIGHPLSRGETDVDAAGAQPALMTEHTAISRFAAYWDVYTTHMFPIHGKVSTLNIVRPFCDCQTTSHDKQFDRLSKFECWMLLVMGPPRLTLPMLALRALVRQFGIV